MGIGNTFPLLTALLLSRSRTGFLISSKATSPSAQATRAWFWMDVGSGKVAYERMLGSGLAIQHHEVFCDESLPFAYYADPLLVDRGRSG
jgi:hypothetical protein